MAKSPANPLVKDDRITGEIADEQSVGAHFDGESDRERKVGIDREVVVDIFRRDVGPLKGTHFLRVSLRSMINSNIILRYELDVDRYQSEREFLDAVQIGAGALAEQDCEKRGATWDCENISKVARGAARELLHDIND